MIKKLLAYQEKDKERLAIILTVENGRVKRELDLANTTLNNARTTLLQLENDAQILTAAFESSIKNLNELFSRMEQYKKQNNPKSEDEINSAVTYLSSMQSKIAGYENQLADIAKRITEKTAQFEETKTAVGRAQSTRKTLELQFEQQQKAIEPKLAQIDADLKKLGNDVNPDLLAKYKARRKSDKSGKIVDIAVALLGDKCGGCFHEMPLLLQHRIATDGYILCEGCGKIIYKI